MSAVAAAALTPVAGGPDTTEPGTEATTSAAEVAVENLGRSPDPMADTCGVPLEDPGGARGRIYPPGRVSDPVARRVDARRQK